MAACAETTAAAAQANPRNTSNHKRAVNLRSVNRNQKRARNRDRNRDRKITLNNGKCHSVLTSISSQPRSKWIGHVPKPPTPGDRTLPRNASNPIFGRIITGE